MRAYSFLACGLAEVMSRHNHLSGLGVISLLGLMQLAPFLLKKEMGRENAPMGQAQHTRSSHQLCLGRTLSPGWVRVNHQLERLVSHCRPSSSEAGCMGDTGRRRRHVGTAALTPSAWPPLSSARRDPSLASGRRGQTGRRELAFLL